MKYFEVVAPYYALIAAEDEKTAIEIYSKDWFEVDESFNENVTEVDRKCALGKFGDVVSRENPDIHLTEMVGKFEKRSNEFLLIDGRLAK
ncbi:hypothetical protein [Bacillus sp. TH008]|uniref:hypothetical protein n=1 Tax=Bacillus sp. TH008 TaxID=1609979 RepID=UPI0006171E99|nr:hypothetical protein [Bacillus sp. TH008]KKB72469.1 hypothetical protein TH62_16685 [Bacillus sp. TH008]